MIKEDGKRSHKGVNTPAQDDPRRNKKEAALKVPMGEGCEQKLSLEIDEERKPWQKGSLAWLAHIPARNLKRQAKLDWRAGEKMVRKCRNGTGQKLATCFRCTRPLRGKRGDKKRKIGEAHQEQEASHAGEGTGVFVGFAH